MGFSLEPRTSILKNGSFLQGSSLLFLSIFISCENVAQKLVFLKNSRRVLKFSKMGFRRNGFSGFLEISRRVLDFPKMGFRRNGFYFWAPNLNTQKWFIFTREFLTIFEHLYFLLKFWYFSRILDACSNSQKWVFEEMGFSERLLKTKARKMVNHFCENILYFHRLRVARLASD